MLGFPFPRNFITQGSIRSRQGGVGLDISFANLAYASRCLSFIKFEDGLIVHGTTSVLIPMAELEDKSIQWHFESKITQPGRKLTNIPQILKLHDIKAWHKELDPSKLMSSRCFLGWAETTAVVIGTREYSLNLGPSRASLAPAVMYLQSY